MSYFRARTKGMHGSTPLGVLLRDILSRTMVCRRQAARALGSRGSTEGHPEGSCLGQLLPEVS